MTRRKPTTARELKKMLASQLPPEPQQSPNPRFVAAHAAADKDAEEVAAELRRRGVAIESIGALDTPGPKSVAAYVELLDLLPSVKNPIVRRGVVWALGKGLPTKQTAHVLLGEFRAHRDDPSAWDEPTGMAQFAIADVLSRIADASMFDEIAQLATDSRFGGTRTPLLLALARTRDPRAVDILRDQLRDPDVVWGAIVGLRRLRAVETLPDIRPFVDHPVQGIRAEARKTVRNFEKALAGSSSRPKPTGRAGRKS